MPIHRSTFLICLAVGLGGCQTSQQIAADTPPAMVSVIAFQDPLNIESGSVGLSAWPGENRFYIPPDPTPIIGSTFVYTGFDTIRLVAVDAVRREIFANK